MLKKKKDDDDWQNDTKNVFCAYWLDNSLSITISMTVRIYFEPTLLSYECGVRFSLFEVSWNQVATWVRMA